MKPEHLGVLEEDAAVAMDNGLGFPGRPRRKQDIERVVEIEGRELERVGWPTQNRPNHPTPAAPVCQRRGTVATRPCAPLGSRERMSLCFCAPVDGPGAVPVTVDAQECGRLDLRKPVKDAGYAHLRGARSPDGADAGRSASMAARASGMLGR